MLKKLNKFHKNCRIMQPFEVATPPEVPPPPTGWPRPLFGGAPKSQGDTNNKKTKNSSGVCVCCTKNQTETKSPKKPTHSAEGKTFAAEKQKISRATMWKVECLTSWNTLKMQRKNQKKINKEKQKLKDGAHNNNNKNNDLENVEMSWEPCKMDEADVVVAFAVVVVAAAVCWIR